MSLVLIVDDVEPLREQYAYDLERIGGFTTLTAGDGKQALRLLETEPVDCVILDLEMPGMDGFAVLQKIQEDEAPPPVIVYTGTGNFERCVRAVKMGAAAFLDKAEPMPKVVQEVRSVLERGRLQREVRELRSRLSEESPLVGESRAMQNLREAIARVASIPSPVLVLGESGTGKELVARELHRLSPRAGNPLLALNAAAFPEGLVESELFGHEAGAFTGAERLRKGAFETASGGTLFLDEIGEMPAPVQAKLLRVLETGSFARVGGNREVVVDTRVVAATHRDLEQETGEGRFRTDLLYRLNVHVLTVPPLRERLSDLPLLVNHFLGALCERFGMPRKRMSSDALARLEEQDWSRNNVRELRNTVERMIIAAEGDVLEADHVPDELIAGGFSGGSGTFRDRKSAAERAILVEALDRNDWHITNTAAELGLADHSSLLKIMRRHGLKR